MKKIMLSISTVLALGFAACGGEAGHDHQHGGDGKTESRAAAPHGEGKEFTSAFVCPMHCEGSGSDQPGTCPACGMDYVAQSEPTKDGHKH
ncbi:MAG: hypothetical protein HY842_18060 [Bacteroidetes bacterium]|nr:hypothetical protein [Bacteroidota bacterium]